MKKTQLGPGLAESGLGKLLRGERPSYELVTGRRGGKEDAARPRGIQRPYWGELRDVKRPACNAVADRRMLNLRPSCVSYAAGMRSPSKRRTCLQQAGALRPKGPWPKHLTHIDHGVENEAQKALRPRCPAGEAINSNHQTGVQRKKGLSLQPTGRGRERRAYHSVHRPVLRAKGLITPHWQHSLVGDLAVQPGMRDCPPGF